MKNIKTFDFLNEEDTNLNKNRLTIIIDKDDYDCVNRIFKINNVYCNMIISTKDGAQVIFQSAEHQNKGLDFLAKVNIGWKRFYKK